MRKFCLLLFAFILGIGLSSCQDDDFILPEHIEDQTGSVFKIYYTSNNNERVVPKNEVYGRAKLLSSSLENDSVGSLSFDNPVTTIPENAFKGCSNLSSINLPENVMYIKEGAFHGSGIKSINVPKYVESIGKDAFTSTPLTRVIFDSDVPPTLADVMNTFPVENKGFLIYTPYYKAEVYASTWRKIDKYIYKPSIIKPVYADWLKMVSDKTFIRDLCIPGTHDSGTMRAQEFGQDQSYTVEEQFDLGVRLFDLRVACSPVTGDPLYIFHGVLPCSISFKTAAEAIFERVKKYSSEFAFVIVNDEVAVYNKWADGFNRTMRGIINEEQYFKQKYGTMVAELKPNMTVRDMRGKVLFINRCTKVIEALKNDPEMISKYGEDMFLGCFASSWNKNGMLYNAKETVKVRLYVQDEYEFDQSDSDEAARDKMSNHFLPGVQSYDNLSSQNIDCIGIHHLSGYNKLGGGFPLIPQFGRAVNKLAVQYFKQNKFVKEDANKKQLYMTMGFVAMDRAGDPEYSGSELIDCIIGHSMKLEDQRYGHEDPDID